MKREHLLHTNQIIDFLDRRLPAFRRADIVAGGKKMRRVETNAKTLRLIDFVEHRREVSNAMSETTSLPGCVLQRNPNWRIFRHSENFIQASDDLIEALFFAGSEMRARMQHEKRNAKVRGEVDFLNERFQ